MSFWEFYLICTFAYYMLLGVFLFTALITWALMSRGFSNVNWARACELFFEMIFFWPLVIWRIVNG